jgi:oligoendopeptidase F
MPSAAEQTTTIPARADVPRETTWDTDSIFATPSDWQAAFDSLQGRGEEIAARFQGRLAEGPETLAAYFTASEDLLRSLSHVAVYANLTYSVDTNDQQAAARVDRVRGLFARTAAALAFAEPEMLQISPDALLAWADANAAGLGVYRHYFDQLARRAPHVRSAEVEQLLKQAGEAFASAASIHGVLTNTDLTFSPATDEAGGTHEIGQGTIGKLLTHSDREVRRTAYENYADAHLAHKSTLAACLATGVKQDVFVARARGYESALHAALAPNHIPVEVFHSLIETYKANLPTWHRYWGLRRRALGLDKLAPYDVKAPLSGTEPVVPYRQAVEWIADGMAPLGEEYVAILRRGATEERWVDVYPNKGKRMGAFSSGTPGTNPFIMMSYNDDLPGLSTLAHELGHSLHSYLTWQNQPYIYSRYGLFAAEVASNFNQALVRAHLMERFKEDRDVQIALIEEAMGNFHRYFFVMPTLARFEQEIHERVWRGEALTAQSLTDLMADLFAEGFGPEVEVDRARVGSTWMQFSSHLYSNFYVFQYATGISGAHALAERVLKEGAYAAEDYLSFLRAGGSLYPLDALKRAGVDLSGPAPVEKTFGVLARYVDRLESLLASPRT